MTEPATQQTIADTVRSEAQKALDEWLGKNPAQKIRSEVTRMLNRERDSIVAALMGFRRDSFFTKGVWEVDSVNGRKSLVTNFIKVVTDEAIGDWLRVQADDLPPVPEEAREAFVKEYISTFKATAKRHAADMARKDATKYVESLILERVEVPPLDIDEDVAKKAQSNDPWGYPT